MSKKSITVFTEKPEDELWRKLLQYTYKAKIKKYFADNSIDVEDTEERLCETITGSLLQAHEYYCLSKSATLHTSPLLLYYGTINLLLGASTLLSGMELDIEGHGMKVIEDSSSNDIGSTKIHFISPKTGGINVFNQRLESSICPLTDLDDLSIEEILLSVPEIYLEATQCYTENDSYCIPIEQVLTEDGSVERISFQGKSQDVIVALLNRVSGFSKSYLTPTFSQRETEITAILRHKYLQDSISYQSLTGQPYLIVSHTNKGKNIVLPQWIMMTAALFGMASLCRYYPQIWNPFIRLDEKGEKLLIEKFIGITRRKLPNIILSMIEKCEYSFENKKYEPNNQIKVLGEHEIKALIQSEIQRKDKK